MDGLLCNRCHFLVSTNVRFHFSTRYIAYFCCCDLLIGLEDTKTKKGGIHIELGVGEVAVPIVLSVGSPRSAPTMYRLFIEPCHSNPRDLDSTQY